MYRIGEGRGLSTKLEEEKKILKAGDKVIEAKAIIIATGAAPRLLGIPGEQEMYGGKGVTTCATCDGAFYRDMDVVVVGGGDSACEEALFLTRFCSSVTVLHRRNQFRASKIMADRVLDHPKIKVLWDTKPLKIIPDEEGKVKSVQISNIKNGETSEVFCKGVFIAIGHVPNTKCFENELELDENGYLIPKTGSSVLTNIPGVYVAGDCADDVEKILDYWDSQCKPVALGEIGLDYFHLPKDKNLSLNHVIQQQQCFSRQLDLARLLDCPVIIHSRNSFKDCVNLIDQSRLEWERVVFHCFSEGELQMKEISSRGGRASFTGNITYPGNDKILEAVKYQGVEKLILETDSPYLSPEPNRKSKNEPCRVNDILDFIRLSFELDLAELEDMVWKNTQDFLNLVKDDLDQKLDFLNKK